MVASIPWLRPETTYPTTSTYEGAKHRVYFIYSSFDVKKIFSFTLSRPVRLTRFCIAKCEGYVGELACASPIPDKKKNQEETLGECGV